MMTMKKIGAVLATIIISLVRFPLTCFAAVINWIDFSLVELNVNLAKVIDSVLWKEVLYEAMEKNVVGFDNISEYFEELQEDLA